MDVKQLGLNIKKIRKAASLTQYELAEKIGSVEIIYQI